MTKQRKQIIVHEIKYWKQNKLLPEHYCDFLITLYTQGEQTEDADESPAILQKEKRRKRVKNFAAAFVALLLITIAAIAMFAVADHPEATLAGTAILTAALLLLTMRKVFLKRGFAPILYISSAFLLLMMSIRLWDVYFQGDLMILVGLLILHCSLWLFTGRLLHMLYFTISGAVGLLLVVGFLIVSF